MMLRLECTFGGVFSSFNAHGCHLSSRPHVRFDPTVVGLTVLRSFCTLPIPYECELRHCYVLRSHSCMLECVRPEFMSVWGLNIE